MKFVGENVKWLISNTRFSTVGVFFAAVFLLLAYLLSMRWNVDLPIILFWVSILLMVGTIIHQCLNFKLSSGYIKIVLLEIIVACLMLHLVYQIPSYALYGSDSYIDMNSMKGILSSGSIQGDPQYVNSTSDFPMIHVIGAQLSLITDIAPLSVAKWFPSLFDVMLIPLIFLLVRRIFGDKVALLSALLFACLEHHILFSSLFVRETIALVYMMSCVFFYFTANSSRNPIVFYVLAATCLVLTVFAHHLTNLMLVAFLLTHFVVSGIIGRSTVIKSYIGDSITGVKISGYFVLLAIAGSLIYWTFVAEFPLYTLAELLEDIFAPSIWGEDTYAESAEISSTSIQTARGYILYYGFYFFMLVFGALLLYQLTFRGINRRFEVYSFTLFLLLVGFVGLVSLYVLPARAFPDRFLSFGWLFGFPVLVLAVFKFKRQLFRTVGISLVIAFSLLNLYMIDRPAWDPEAKDIPPAPTREDYAFADTFDFDSRYTASYRTGRMANYDVQNAQNDHGALPGNNIFSVADLSRYEWAIVQKQELWRELEINNGPTNNTIAEMERLVKGDSIDRNTVFESNSIVIFKLR